jgi:ATP-dependent helicase/nuclease subunit B
MDMGYQYLGWDQPFSLSFADRLLAEAGAGRNLDEWLIWVPSSRAGRHVLNELFTGGLEDTEAFHPPRMETPAQFVESLLKGPKLADACEQLLCWKSTLMQVKASEIATVFPVLPETGRDLWAYAIARQLMQLRKHLVEQGWSMAKVAQQPLEHDRDRWQDLSHLERMYLANLNARGLEDPDMQYEQSLWDSVSLFPYKRIIVAGVMNLSQRQIHVLEVLASSGIQVDHYLPIPEALGETIDRWGRPLAGVWDKQPVPGSLLENKVQRASEPRELVEKVLELTDIYQRNVDALVLGSPVSEIGEYAIERSKLTETPFYAPTGKPIWETSLGRFLQLIHEFGTSGQLTVLQELLLHFQFRKWALAQGCPVERIEASILILMRERLVQDSQGLRDSAFAPNRHIQIVREFIDLVDSTYLRRNMRSEAYPEWIWRIVQTVSLHDRESAETSALLGQIEELLMSMRGRLDPDTVSEGDYWELLKYQLQSIHYYPEREAEQRPVSGWLELPWERAPHMVILGLPDNEVPGGGSMDSFITPALCRQLKMYGVEDAAAFHAFRLRLILESRKKWGKLDILLPDRGLDDDPLTTSRFLFQSSEEEVLDRVNLLLGERDSPENMFQASFGGQLNLPHPPVPDRIHVTSFSAYLGNPFRFHLERLHGWTVPEALPMEMDALRFGSLAHAVMEELNGSDEGRSLKEAADIDSFLMDHLHKTVSEYFGSGLSVPVRIQISAMEERLRAAAAVISGERKAGWMPEKVEWAFHEEMDFLVGGLPLRGRIDLLEKNAKSGAYRIVDYKTSDKAVDPCKTHLVRQRAGAREPVLPECVFETGEAEYRWKDLQLPLYQVAVEKALGVEASCAYFSLAKAVKDIRLMDWHPGKAERTAALACAEAIVDAIKRGYFPTEGESRYEDPWLTWFGGNYTGCIQADWLAKHVEGPS